MRWKAKRRQPQPRLEIPTAPDLGTALGRLAQGLQECKVGVMTVTRMEGGGIRLSMDDNIDVANAAVRYFEVLRSHVARGMVVRINMWAMISGSWTLPGGIRRRTSPGLTHKHVSFTSVAELRRWEKTTEGRAMLLNHTLRWDVTASRRG